MLPPPRVSFCESQLGQSNLKFPGELSSEFPETWSSIGVKGFLFHTSGLM
jgi:hypothetical protein